MLAIPGIAAIVSINIWATHGSLVDPRRMQNRLQRLVDPLQRLLLQGLVSNQTYPADAAPPVPRPNGRPPHDPDWQASRGRLPTLHPACIGPPPRQPLALTLEDLRALPACFSQTTKHVCIQGWSQIVSWKGVSLAELLERAHPLPDARYLLFRTFDDKWEHAGEHGYFYGVVDLEIARHPQSILAYEMNGRATPGPVWARHSAFGLRASSVTRWSSGSARLSWSPITGRSVRARVAGARTSSTTARSHR